MAPTLRKLPPSESLVTWLTNSSEQSSTTTPSGSPQPSSASSLQSPLPHAPSSSDHRRKTLKEATITKMPEVEEIADLYLHRPLAGYLVWLLVRLPFRITPTQITWTSLITGVIGSLFIYGGFSTGVNVPVPSFAQPFLSAYLPVLASALPNDLVPQFVHPVAVARDTLNFPPSLCFLVAALFVLMTCVIDCADGQYARATGTGSFIGRISDGVVDMLNIMALSLSFISGMALRYGTWGFVCAAASCMCMQQHALVYDKMKNAFVLHLRSEPELAVKTEDVLEMYKKAKSERRVYDTLILGFACYYVDTAYMNVIPSEDPEKRMAFRNANSLSMRMAAYLGIGTGNAIWYTSLALAAFIPSAPWLLIIMNCVVLVILNIAVRLRTKHTLPNHCQLNFWNQEAPPMRGFFLLAVGYYIYLRYMGYFD